MFNIDWDSVTGKIVKSIESMLAARDMNRLRMDLFKIYSTEKGFDSDEAFNLADNEVGDYKRKLSEISDD